MDDAPRSRLSDFFERALGLPAEERRAFVDEACEGDPALRDELLSLLEAYDASSGYFEVLGERIVAPALIAVADGAPPAVAPGEAVGHYEIIEQLGAGGMGVVYKARDLHLDRFVALKFLAPQLASDEAARARLVSEAKAASALDHPNIAVVHEIGETDDGRLFIAMGWYAGETLKERLRRGPLPVREAIDIARQLAGALAAAHGAGIVHRDVKPSNVVVTGKGTAKLLDFGIARMAGVDLTTDGSTLGTVAYMSPEQTRGDAVDQRTDLWSLGVVLYEMLTARRPFRGENEQAIIYAIRNDRPEPIWKVRPDIPPDLADVLDGCLQKDPASRHQTADEVRSALDPPPGGHGDGRARPLRRRRPTARQSLTAMLIRPMGLAATAAAFGLLALSLYLASTHRTVPGLDAERILVAPLENLTGDGSAHPIGSMAADWITQGLARTGLVDVVPVTAALSASRFVGAASDDPAENVRLLAQETGAGIVVSGAIYRQRDSLYLQVTVTDAIRGRVLHALEPVVTPFDHPLLGIETLRDRLMGILAPRFNPRTQHHAAGGGVAPPSFEAYRAHAEGMERFTAGDWRGSLPFYMEAAAHDSSFTVPLLYAAIAYGNTGDFAASDSILALVRPRRHLLGEFEQLGFAMLEATSRGDHEAFYRAHLRAPELAPGTFAHWGLGLGALRLNRPREAVRIMEQLDPERGELRGWFLYWRDLTEAHHRLGQHRKELRAARRARQLIPDDDRGLQAEIRALAALRRTAEVKRLVEEHVDDVRYPAALLRHAGLELIRHGRRADGEALLRESLDTILARPEDGFGYHRFVAQAHFLLGESEEAERLLRQLATDHPENISVKGGLGVLAARRGDHEEAVAISEWLAEVDRPYLYGIHTFWRAQIASLRGQPEEAVRLLRQCFREGAMFNPWMSIHQELNFDPIRDHPAFREFVRPKG